MKNRYYILAVLGLLFTWAVQAQEYKINDLEYFEQTGANVLVFSNQYNGIFCDEKTAGIEIIQRGERISTGGGVRLMNTPEQWDIYAELVDRKVNREDNSITVDFIYKAYDFAYSIKVTSADKGVNMAVYLDKPVPAELAEIRRREELKVKTSLSDKLCWNRFVKIDSHVHAFIR